MKHIARSTLLIAFFFAIDKVLGFARQLLVSREFKLTYQMDVFNAANNIPDLLSALISGGALAVAIIPILAGYLETRGNKETWRVFSQVLNFAFLVTGLLAFVTYFLAPWLISNVIVPGFPAEQKQLAVELMRMNLLAVMVFSLSGLVMAALQAHQHFLLPAIAPAAYDLGQIFGVIFLAPAEGYRIAGISLPTLGLGIHGLVYGVIIGSVLHLLVQIPGLIKYQFRWEAKLQLNSPVMRQVMELLGPRVLTMLFIQAFFIVRDAIASGMGEGSVTALNLGWFIMQVPETLLGTAVAIAILPSLSGEYALGKFKEFTRKINLSLKTLLILTIPAAVFLAIGLFPLAKLAFGFDDAGTQQVVVAAQVYLAGMMGHSLLEVASRSFYAKRNARIPLIAAALNAIAYFILAQVLSRWIGFAGIAWANTIVFTVESLLLLVILNRQHPGVLDLMTGLPRLLLSTVTMAVLLGLAVQYLTFLPVWLMATIGMGGAMAVVIVIMRNQLKPMLSLT
ncbi:MAG: murein biosynthesis integral membrane protein MurJ [Anaerolineae bacterium]|nr:murein biosynthesis integral membrane protein MurJ [Anaerolineae bacterium]